MSDELRAVKQKVLDAIYEERAVLDFWQSRPASEIDWNAGLVQLWQLAERELRGKKAVPERPNATNHHTAHEALSVLHREVEKLSVDETPPADLTATPLAAEQYVTLDQIAALVSRSKRTLERHVNARNSDAPRPDVEGGGGRPHEWKWSTIRPWLEKQFKRQLPEHFPR